MTTRQILLTIVAGAILLLTWILIVRVSNVQAEVEVSNSDICYWEYWFEEQVKACGNIVRESQEQYPILEAKLKAIAVQASGARNQISTKAKEFYSKNLSGTNVDFQ